MNDHGFTAIADASVFMIMIIIAAGLISATLQSVPDDDGVQDPSEVVDRIMGSRLSFDDVGTGDSSATALMNRIAYVSLTREDHAFSDYVSDILEDVYPWTSSFSLIVMLGDYVEESGSVGGGSEWKSCTRTYQSGYGDDITIILKVFR